MTVRKRKLQALNLSTVSAGNVELSVDKASMILLAQRIIDLL